MLIDAHQHFWSPARGDYGWLTADNIALFRDITPADLLPKLTAGKIEATVLVQAAPTIDETEFLLEMANRHEWIGAVIGWVDLLADPSAQLDRLKAAPKFRGIRPMLQNEHDIAWLTTDKSVEAVRSLGHAGLIFEALVCEEQLKSVEALAERASQTLFVIDHFGKPAITSTGPAASWAASIARLGSLPNVACKLSGLTSLADGPLTLDVIQPYFEVVLTAFGASRVIWGSDWPVVNERSGYAEWHQLTNELLAPLDPSARIAIMGENARRLYRLHFV